MGTLEIRRPEAKDAVPKKRFLYAGDRGWVSILREIKKRYTVRETHVGKGCRPKERKKERGETLAGEMSLRWRGLGLASAVVGLAESTISW
jgi:hypothetical protein